ncbi:MULTISPECIES: MBL fold metallo-hydrolase [unclassified Pseudomonas]|uniref:MBL fold metallo-hydrolase n=1 Tax=unclassified Pseudomonas TaxID=196821 RepID=UPI000BD02865|nr:MULTISPECIES: MBL fold metallo-hydrolase [unclassified Pseudomonas]PVZ13683.1 metallo-beta-lactamase superfamily protein [Pseudomonas sp. URIL14HWK12:I12]PVZ23989.1 metallo-beta-lactamase superfamily protein [Pseudomonas sp. URIL14HWK12:I10]PVZ33372.1 metallo-beta-lactamase superfamily protein [Pseudomonas sp. URIL14HWK12:I11]SNZ11324.1 Zn-dependent hydrolases, including glyoxylases [Pseudomonas sp. URIL14HWK12:I9]
MSPDLHQRRLPSQQVGEFTVTALSDGYLGARLDFLANISPEDAAQLQLAAGISDPAAIHINCYLVQGRGRTILVDAGAGGLNQWGGELLNHLARAGVQPADIDTVLLTHAHPDHIGGLIDAAGGMAFANAELVVHERELAFWEDDGNLGQASERARGNFLLARSVFERYRKNLRPFTTNDVLPGISAQALPGHTAGHCGYRFESGGGGLLIWGDIVHFPHIQIAHPQVTIAFDHDPLVSAATRARLLDIASSDHLMVAGMHLGALGFARIERFASGYFVVYET